MLPPTALLRLRCLLLRLRLCRRERRLCLFTRRAERCLRLTPRRLELRPLLEGESLSQLALGHERRRTRLSDGKLEGRLRRGLALRDLMREVRSPLELELRPQQRRPLAPLAPRLLALLRSLLR